jgi:hypothetical protein
MPNFSTVGQIIIQPYDEIPYKFKFNPAPASTEKGAIPYGTNITGVDVVVTDLTDGTDVTTLIITGTPTVSSNIVTCICKYPGYDGKFKFTFKLTLDTGSKKEFDFKRVESKTI